MELTAEEIKAIDIWTSASNEYRIVKQILREEVKAAQPTYIKISEDLIGLFNKYNDNTNKEQVLYRGDIIDYYNVESVSEQIDSFLQEFKIGSSVSLDKSILSFTYSKSVAKESIKLNDKYISKSKTPTVLFMITKRHSTFLDISEFSNFKFESEILCNRNLNFCVQKLIQEGDNNFLCELIEV